MDKSKIAQKNRRVDSPLLIGVRQGISCYLRQKKSIGLDTVLLQYPKILGPMVLAALDDLARDGMITVSASYCGRVGVMWRDDVEGTRKTA